MRHDHVVKGIIFNLLQTVTEEAHGEAAWDEMLSVADVDGSYTALGNYPDAEITALVTALAARTGADSATVLQWFGRAAMPHLRTRYPAFFAPGDPVAMVTTLHDLIHTEVRKLYPGADPPDLAFSEITPSTVTIDYTSGRAMADLAIGFLHGVADAYGAQLFLQRDDLEADGTHVRLACRFVAA